MLRTLETDRLVAGLDAEALADARERFYPDWWMFNTATVRPDARPAYRVVCRSEAERDLAYHVKPSFVDAQIVLEHR
jgi:hypothetical protein